MLNQRRLAVMALGASHEVDVLIEEIQRQRIEQIDSEYALHALTAEIAKLREFAESVMEQSFQGLDFDGSDAHDLAEELGFLEVRPCAPEDSIDGETEHHFVRWLP